MLSAFSALKTGLVKLQRSQLGSFIEPPFLATPVPRRCIISIMLIYIQKLLALKDLHILLSSVLHRSNLQRLLSISFTS